MAEHTEENGTVAGAFSRVVRSVADSPFHFYVYFFITAIIGGVLFVQWDSNSEMHQTLRQCMSTTMVPSTEPP